MEFDGAKDSEHDAGLHASDAASVRIQKVEVVMDNAPFYAFSSRDCSIVHITTIRMLM